MPNTASPAVASTIGLKNVVIAPLTADTEETLAYGSLQDFAGAIDAQLAPENTDPDVQYFDDVEGHVLYPDPEIKLTMEMADVPLSIQEMILSNQIDANGVKEIFPAGKFVASQLILTIFQIVKITLVRTAGDQPPYFALGFRSEKSDRTFRYVWLFKGRAAPMSETYHTKEGKTITRQTGKLEWTFLKRTHDGRYQAVADEGQNGFTPEKAAAFLTSVYELSFTGEP